MLKMAQVNDIRDLSNSGYRIAEISKKKFYSVTELVLKLAEARK